MKYISALSKYPRHKHDYDLYKKGYTNAVRLARKERLRNNMDRSWRWMMLCSLYRERINRLLIVLDTHGYFD